MILSREITKEIESHFYNHQQERFDIERRIKEIAEESGGADESGIRGSGISDPTIQKVGKIEKELARAKAWVRVVSETVEHFKETPYADFIAMVFVERSSPVKVQNELYLCEKTYFNWKERVILYAAMKACSLRLIIV